MSYEEQLSAARFRAERDQARQELYRARWDAENMRVELCSALVIDVDTGWSDAMAELDRRLMPEGYEWPKVDGKPVDFVTGYEPSLGVLEAVSIYNNGACEVMGHDGIIKNVKEIHVSTHKVLDADGVEIREKRDVWWICEGDERGVHAEKLHVESIGEDGLIECSPYNGGTWVYLEPSELYVNEPVPASDGRPLEVGQTVWRIDTGVEYWVKSGQTITADAVVIIRKTDCDCESEIVKPSQLTHERPVPGADGKPLREKSIVFDKDTGEKLGVDAVATRDVTCRRLEHGGMVVHYTPEFLTHERPDSWERIEEDAGCTATKYNERRGTGFTTKQQVARDLVRRCRALAERERGE